MKKIISVRYLEYLKNLLEQFKGATGARRIKIEDLFDSETSSEFDEWLENRQIDGEYYKRMLHASTDKRIKLVDGVYIDDHIDENFYTCEIGKGPMDSLVTDTNASVISPVADLFDKKHRRNLIVGDFDPQYGENYVRMSNNSLRPVYGAKTIMTQNPYDYSKIAGLPDIHNSGRGRVIVGIYGSVYDKDREKKTKEFMRFANRFTKDPCQKYRSHIIIDDTPIGSLDTYFSYLISEDNSELTKYGHDARAAYKGFERQRIINEAKSLKRGR